MDYGDINGLGELQPATDLNLTGQAQGDILYFNGTNWVRLPAGTAGQRLETQGAGANPTWENEQSNLTGDVTSVGLATTIANDAVTTAKILDDNVTIAKIADGTDGELITWDASGEAATVPTGTSGQVLTSNGAGAAPTFQTPAGGGMTLAQNATFASATNVSITTESSKNYRLIIIADTSASGGTTRPALRFNNASTASYLWTGMRLNITSSPTETFQGNSGQTAGEFLLGDTITQNFQFYLHADVSTQSNQPSSTIVTGIAYGNFSSIHRKYDFTIHGPTSSSSINLVNLSANNFTGEYWLFEYPE